jgi:hypothetical protein
MSVPQELIRIYMEEHYESLTPEQLKEEAERLQKHLSKQAAGRVCWQSREDHEDREAAFAKIDAYYKDKKEWNKLFQPRVSKSAGKE